jgi:adenylate kinase
MIKVVFLIGKPACGKDVQADLLVKNLKFKKIVTSQELNKLFLKYKSQYLKIGKIKINLKKQKLLKEKGQLVSYRLVSWLVKKKIIENLKRGYSIVFAGSPRSIYEAKSCLATLKNFKNIKYYFIYLKVSNQTVIKRALERLTLEKRQDDRLEVVKKRLKIFKKQMLPMINYLKNQKKLIEINGEDDIIHIHKKILKIINEDN